MIAFHYVEGSSWDSFSIERYVALIMGTKSVLKKNVLFVSKATHFAADLRKGPVKD